LVDETQSRPSLNQVRLILIYVTKQYHDFVGFHSILTLFTENAAVLENSSGIDAEVINDVANGIVSCKFEAFREVLLEGPIIEQGPNCSAIVSRILIPYFE